MALFAWMQPPTESIVLVTPVWNDSSRLERFGVQLAEVLKEASLSVTWVIADDGSDAGEQLRLASLVECLEQIYPKTVLLTCEQRSRKGGAIYAAWDGYDVAQWLAFVDADGAIRAETILNLLVQAQNSENTDALIAVRKHSEEYPLKRSPLRRLSFWLFHCMVRILTGLKLSDTQCGAKVVRGSAYRSVRDQLVEHGFVFDVELLLALRSSGHSIEEVPIGWEAKANGKINPLREAWSMIVALWRIRNRASCYFLQDHAE